MVSLPQWPQPDSGGALMSINNQKMLKVVNLCITVFIALQAGSGFFHSMIPGEVFEKVHGTSGIILTTGIVIHVYLNRKWFFTTFRKHQ
jgi:hypothetical protein